MANTWTSSRNRKLKSNSRRRKDSLGLLPQSDEAIESKTLRIFLSFNPDPRLLDRIAAIQQRLRDYLESISSPVASQLRWTKVSQLHLTLLFFGDVTPASTRAIEQDLSEMEMPEPQLILSGIGCFPMVRRPKVLWLGVKVDKHFQSLQTELIARFAQRYGLDKAPSYPHLTLARVQKPSRSKPEDPELTVTADLQRFDREFHEEPILWRPEFVSLMRSDSTTQGKAYHSIAAIRLKPPA